MQYEGIAKIPHGEELDKLFKVYRETFPDGMVRNQNWKNIAYFVVEPRWIRYSDFNLTPPQIHEMNFFGEKV